MIYNNLLFSEGRTILAIGVIGTLLGFMVYPWLGLIGLCFLAFSFYFFRNPERLCTEKGNPSVIISPADGKIVAIERALDDRFEGFSQKISIFLSPLDVHVNWTPMAGEVCQVKYKPGKFLVAYTPKSSELNERNDVILVDRERKILVRQIAGKAARRIVCWIKPGQTLEAGVKYGMIRFGSRVDVLLPYGVHIEVRQGDRVQGGGTILGRWNEPL
jgi:phosphatidylserine decarboxylase